MTKQVELPEPYPEPLYKHSHGNEYFEVIDDLFTADQMRQFREEGVREALAGMLSIYDSIAYRGIKSKQGKCSHGLYSWDDCEQCLIAAMTEYAQSQAKGE